MSLHKGSKGEEVRRLQEDLKALGLYRNQIDGDFGKRTRQAILDFQQQYFVDGIVTSEVRMSINEAVIAWANCERNILVSVPQGFDELHATFGQFEWEESVGGFIEITDDWEDKNIILVDLPVVGKKYIHKRLMPVFESVLKEIQDKGLDGGIYCFSTWVPRHLWHDPSRGLSMHSWGIAADINWPTNKPSRIGDLDPGIVAAFERHGFQWGGRWRHRDDMHFQYFQLN